MRLLEHNHSQRTNQASHSHQYNSLPSQPKLTMIWLEEYHEGKPRLTARWVVK